MLHNDNIFSHKPHQFLKIINQLSLSYFLKLFLVISSVASVMWMGQKLSLFPIRYIKIVGSHSVELNAALRHTIEPLLKDRTRRINLQALEAQLKQWSCVEKIVLWPILPYTLIVHLRIREPVALFQVNGTTLKQPIQWVDRTGFLFEASPQTMSKNLPKLIGSCEQSKHLVRYYQAFSTLLKPHSLQLSILRLDRENRCSIGLANGIQLLLGHLNPIGQLQKLLNTHPPILHQSDKITILDLRYPNGMAITWHEPTP